MTGITLRGFVASGITMVSFLPQGVQTWRSGTSEDLSFGMYLLLSLGTVLWLSYTFLSDDLPIILTHAVLLVLMSSVLAQVLWDRRRPAS
ncbi:MAG: SemiSWEET family transporter [Bacteroidota bacterium]